MVPVSAAAGIDAEVLSRLVPPPYSLGAPAGTDGVWTLLNSGGAEAGYVVETEPLAPLPGFSGAPIDMLVMLDRDARILDVRLLKQNEPIFVSGLGEAPFREFLTQYRGHSIHEQMVVGSPYGAAADGALVYLDGVTKATASVRIAHETILAAALAVAREKMQGVAAIPPARPDPSVDESLTWDDLVRQGLVSHFTVTNREVDAAFAGTIWAHDDPVAQDDRDGVYLDLWVADLGPPSIARAALAPGSLAELQKFLSISADDEPILVIDTGRHGLVSRDFVRNTAPDLLAARQDDLPVALRDADLTIDLASGAPEDGTAMILRTDRRLGFDPTRAWTLDVTAMREHGMFRPEIGRVTFSAPHVTDARFFVRPEVPQPVSPWRAALAGRRSDLVIAAGLLALLLPMLLFGQSRLAGLAAFVPLRLGILAVVLVFFGWWGQGQLSIVTVMGVLSAVQTGGSLAFLAYDPFSLLIWAAAAIGFVLWGRGLFCGWLCPFGAMQEFSHWIGRGIGIPQITVTPHWDRRLKWIKYGILGALLAVVLLAPAAIDKAAEVEPFKTAITVHFVREWYYVAYAGLWLVLGLSVFKGFCRYVCPLGAVMVLGGLLRRRSWIPRRAACGSPCQLCRVRCRYGAIERSGRIDYAECFQCLDCVTIHDDPAQCVPLVLAGRRRPAPAAKVPVEGVPAE
ncbi:MAG: 4Fe-4S binding protein [Rhodobacteraceae bacterium]|nr:4Fe-4S binding protein [Paracoccaceae bacterium]